LHFAYLHFVFSSLQEASHNSLQFANLFYVQPFEGSIHTFEIEVLTAGTDHWHVMLLAFE
jgi:hypothetical protein